MGSILIDRQSSRRALERDFLETLTGVARELRTVFNARVTEHGLTYARARALLRLLERPSITQKELACLLELEQPTTGRLLDTMERLSLIERVEAPRDRRAKQIALTAHGREQAELVAAIGSDIRRDLFSGIPDAELDDMMKLLETVRSGSKRLSPHAAAASGDAK